jgi:uncharacterized membrane protein (DUF485 family)
MLHEPAQRLSDDKAAKEKSRLGVKMFIIYTVVYTGFVIIGLTKPELMGKILFAGQNIAIVYGFGLIILAIVMGFIYNYLCTRMENRVDRTDN